MSNPLHSHLMVAAAQAMKATEESLDSLFVDLGSGITKDYENRCQVAIEAFRQINPDKSNDSSTELSIRRATALEIAMSMSFVSWDGFSAAAEEADPATQRIAEDMRFMNSMMAMCVRKSLQFLGWQIVKVEGV